MFPRVPFPLARPFGLAGLAAALLTCAIVAAAAAGALWSMTTESDILFQRLTPLGTVLVSMETGLMAVDPATGKALWTREDVRKLRECNYDEIANSPYGLLDLGEGTGGSQRRSEVIDLETGRKQWDSENLPFNSSQGLMQAPRKGLLLVAGTHRKSREPVFCAVDAGTGALLWSGEHKLKSRVAQMALTARGLLVRVRPGLDDKGKPDGKPFIDLLDPGTGESVWKKPFKDLEDATTFDIRGDKACIAADGEMFAISLADGAATPVARYKFKGGEVPVRLDVVEDDYLLSSSQNMMMLDPSGHVKFHTCEQAPGAGGRARLATTALGVAANATSAANAYGMAQATAETRHYPLIASNPTLSKRFKAGASAQNFMSMRTTVEVDGRKGVGLVKLDKSTGREVAKVVLGDPAPSYELDGIDNRLFLMKSDREIVCYPF